MKLHRLLLTILLVAGCEKSSNVAAMQDEVTGMTNHYKQRFDDLSKRVAMLEQRGRSMVSIGTPQGLNDVRKLFLDTNKRLAELKTAVAQAPGSLAQASKAEHSRVELIKLMGELDERFSKGETEVNAQIDQVEQWLAYVEYRPKVAAAEPVKEEPKPQPTPENPEMKPEPGAMPNPDEPKPDAPKTDGKTDAKAEPKKDEPKNPPKAEQPKKDAPKKDAPKAGSGSAR
jgi:hypothetical protein